MDHLSAATRKSAENHLSRVVQYLLMKALQIEASSSKFESEAPGKFGLSVSSYLVPWKPLSGLHRDTGDPRNNEA